MWHRYGLRAALATIVCGATPLCASVIHVDVDAPAGGDGQSWATAYSDLHGALGAARPGDELWIATGVYRTASAGGKRDAAFVLPGGVALYGGFAGTESDRDERDWVVNPTILSGDQNGDDTPDWGGRSDNSYNVLRAEDLEAEAIVDGLIVRSGHADDGDGYYINNVGYGGGLWVRRATVRLANMTFEDNAAWNGGGVYAYDDAALVVTSSTFRANLALPGGFSGRGGGIAADRDSTLVVSGCVFERNTGVSGGAASLIHRAAGGFEDCVFDSNIAESSGGATTAREDATESYARCTFRRNRAGNAGGAMDSLGTSGPSLRDCRFEGNSVEVGGGGAIIAQGVEFDAFRCVFIGNEARTDGGAVNALGGRPKIISCTFIGNRSGFGAGALFSGGSSLSRMENLTIVGNSGPMIVAVNNVPLASSTVAGNTITAGDGAAMGPWSNLVNSIVWMNGPGDGRFGQEFQLATPVAVDYSCVQGWDGTLGGTGNTGDDPLFVDTVGADGVPWSGDEDLGLKSGSACVDAGDNTRVHADVLDVDGDGDTGEALPLDAAGDARFRDDPATADSGIPGNGHDEVVDMGAREFAPAPCPADFNGDGLVNLFDFLAFQAAFGNEDPSADLAAPFGVFDLFDFLAFQAVFSDGC